VRSLICFISNEYDKIKCFKKSVVGYIVGWATEFFSCLGYIDGWKPEYFGCLGYIVSCGYPTRTHTRTRGNSVANVCNQEITSIFASFFKSIKNYFIKTQFCNIFSTI
jgi:hypothetical protein